MSEPCQFLEWDTDFFGFRIARVVEHQLNPQLMAEIMNWCAAQRIECLYFLADSDHAETVRSAEDHGFRFVDTRVTLRLRLERRSQDSVEQSGDLVLREVCPADLPALQGIARVSYHLTRYYYDPCFPDEVCDRLYETWITRSCADYADAVLVAEIDSQPVGYISCHLPGDKLDGHIGLVGVAAQAQGRGVGYKLLNYALDWFAGRGVHAVDVVTQGRNIAAQRLYQRGGFLTQVVQLWYHKWFTDCK